MSVTKTGITGYLSPKGKLYQCEYGKHAEFSEVMYGIALNNDPIIKAKREIGEAYESFLNRMGYIAMGSKGYGFRGMGHVRFPTTSYESDYHEKVNKTQQQWFTDHMDELDEEQQEYVKKYIHLFIDKE